jgi:RNA polymerase sigma-70 factor (ECF subfamily)
MPELPADCGTTPEGQLARLLLAARAGSAEALGQALERCRDYLLLIANEEMDSDLQAKGGASDLVQETFLEAHEAFGRFAGAGERELLAWLRQILLHNLANFRRRYRQTEQRQLRREVALDAAGRLQADGSSPSAQAVRREEAEALEKALARLQDHYREVILLRHREQLPFEEIGRRLGRSTDAARMLWWRAFERLSEELNPPD